MKRTSNTHSTHTLDNLWSLYGKLLHTSNVIPEGHAYLTSLETFLGTFSSHPFVPWHAPKHTKANLCLWLNKLCSPPVPHPITGPCPVTDQGAFSDASSGVGVSIIIGGKWQAWTLIPGWDNDSRSIGWAEAIGFKFFTHYLCTVSQPGEHSRYLVMIGLKIEYAWIIQFFLTIILY